jgi:hypothetical protein
MNSTKYIGMDVRKETISIAVMDVAGKLVMEWGGPQGAPARLHKPSPLCKPKCPQAALAGSIAIPEVWRVGFMQARWYTFRMTPGFWRREAAIRAQL